MIEVISTSGSDSNAIVGVRNDGAQEPRRLMSKIKSISIDIANIGPYSDLLEAGVSYITIGQR